MSSVDHYDVQNMISRERISIRKEILREIDEARRQMLNEVDTLREEINALRRAFDARTEHLV